MRTRLLAFLFVSSLVTNAFAQSTGMPRFQAPYRAFEQTEFGAALSFPDGADFGLEGQYSFAYEAFDVGFRTGFVEGGDTSFLLGAEGRLRVIDHESSDFPLDGAVVAGFGTIDFDAWLLPVGISLGRRVEIEGLEFVFYGQPTLFFTVLDSPTGNETDLDFNLGLGADVKVTDSIDVRTSFAFLDAPADGLSVAVVWVH